MNGLVGEADASTLAL